MKTYITKEENYIKKLIFKLKDSLFDQTLTDAQLENLAKKYAKSAVFMVLQEKGHDVGYIAFYCNDNISNWAFISMIVVENGLQNKGMGSKLLEGSMRISKQVGMQNIGLEVSKNNIRAKKFYRKHGFSILEIQETEKSYFMARLI